MTVLLFLGCAKEEDEVLATYSGGVVSIKDFDAHMGGLDPDERVPEAGEDVDAWVRDRIHEIVMERWLVQECESSGFPSSATFSERYSSARVNILAALFENWVSESCLPSLEEARSYYDVHSASFEVPDTFGFRYVFTYAQDGNWERAEKRIEEAYSALQQGRDFREVASQYTETQGSPESVGEVRRVPRGMVNPKIEEQILSLKPGTFSPPFQSKHGYHIVFLEEFEPGRKIPFEEALPGIQETFRTERRAEFRSSILERLRGEHEVRFHEGILEDPEAPDETVVLRLYEMVVTAGQIRETLRQMALRGSAMPGDVTREVIRHASDMLLGAQQASKVSSVSVSSGEGYQSLLEEARRRILFQEGLERRLRAVQTRIREEMIQDHFENHRDVYLTDLERQIRQIGVSFGVPPDATPEGAYLAKTEARTIIESLRERVLRGESAEEIARHHSTLPDAAAGGLQPFTSEIPPLYSIQLEGVVKGGVSEIFEHPSLESWVFLELVGVREPQRLSFREARDQIAAELEQREVRNAFARVQQSVLQETRLQVHDQPAQALASRY